MEFPLKEVKEMFTVKQVEEIVTVLNYVLKGSWEEVGNRGIRKKLKG